MEPGRQAGKSSMRPQNLLDWCRTEPTICRSPLFWLECDQHLARSLLGLCTGGDMPDARWRYRGKASHRARLSDIACPSTLGSDRVVAVIVWDAVAAPPGPTLVTPTSAAGRSRLQFGMPRSTSR